RRIREGGPTPPCGKGTRRQAPPAHVPYRVVLRVRAEEARREIEGPGVECAILDLLSVRPCASADEVGCRGGEVSVHAREAGLQGRDTSRFARDPPAVPLPS